MCQTKQQFLPSQHVTADRKKSTTARLAVLVAHPERGVLGLTERLPSPACDDDREEEEEGEIKHQYIVAAGMYDKGRTMKRKQRQ